MTRNSGVKGIRGVFFDLDGTISDYIGSAWHALDVVWSGLADRLAPHGKETFLECYWRAFKETENLARQGGVTGADSGGRSPRFTRVLRELGLGCDEELLNEMAELYTKGRLEGARLFPGAREVLAALREAYVIGVITEGDGYVQRAQVKALGVADLLDHVIVSSEAGFHKPDVALYHYALGVAELSPGETVMVGDRVDWDLIPAASVGMRTLLFTQRNMYLGLRQEMGFEPDWTAGDYARLMEILLPEDG